MPRRRANLIAYLFLLPWIIGLVAFVGGPIIAILPLSFTSWNLLGSPRWIGLRNYVEMFSGRGDFWPIVFNTLKYAIAGVFVSVTWSLFIALLLNRRVPGAGLAASLCFAPAVVPYIAMAFALQLLLRADLGVINYWLKCVGIQHPPDWLMDPDVVLWTLAAVTIYTYYTGQMMLIFDAALKQVPKELYEVASLDGASSLTIFRHITLPMISPILLFNVVIGFLNTLNMSFTIIYPLTAGGPGKASTVLSVDIYNNAFKGFRIGYACAEAVILFVLCALSTLFIFWLSKRRVYYEA